MTLPAWLQPLIDWMTANPSLAGLCVFVLVAVEGFLIIGLFIPGTVVMFSLGALVATGVLPAMPTLLLAAAGAFFGDSVSYWLGYKGRDHLRRTWPMSRYPQLVAQGERFFGRHGGKSIFLARYIGPLRPIVPAVAGMAGMRPRAYSTVAAFTAITWAPLFMLPGVLVGASLGLLQDLATRFLIALAVVVVSVWFVLWVTQLAFVLLQPYAERVLSWLLRPGLRDSRRGLPALAAVLADPAAPSTRGLLAIGVSLGLFGLLLFCVAWGWPGQGQPTRPDLLVSQTLTTFHTPWLDIAAIVVANLLDGTVLLILSFGVLLLLLLRGHKSAIFHACGAMLFALPLSFLLTQWLAVSAPFSEITDISSLRHSAGYALQATVLLGFISVLIARELPRRWRWMPYAYSIIFIFLGCLSRLYLGEMWFSEWVAGAFLGAVWIGVLGFAFRRRDTRSVPVRRMLWLVILVPLLVGTTRVYVRAADDLAHYRQTPEVPLVEAAEWRRDQWRELAAHRRDFGSEQEHFSLQWRGNLLNIRSALMEAGWRVPAPLNLRNSLNWFNSSALLQDMPILPRAHGQQHERLVMVKPIDADSRWVLRLWTVGTATGSDNSDDRDKLESLLELAENEQSAVEMVWSESEQPIVAGYIAQQRTPKGWRFARLTAAPAGGVAHAYLEELPGRVLRQEQLRADGSSVLLLWF